MNEMPATREAMSGAARNASAMLVSGPVGTSHTPSCARTVSMMNPTASRLAGGPDGAGNSAPSRPLSPCTYPALSCGASNGRLAPAWTATSMPSRSRSTIALVVVDSGGALRATVVMPSRLVWRAATTSAIASSWPGSQSRMIGRSCVGAMSARACHRYHRGVASRALLCLTLLMLVAPACSNPGSSAGVTTTSAPPDAQIARDTIATVATTSVPDATGVPGLAATDPFCAAWAAYASTLQVLGVAGSFGGLSSHELAVLELRAAPRLV